MCSAHLNKWLVCQYSFMFCMCVCWLVRSWTCGLLCLRWDQSYNNISLETEAHLVVFAKWFLPVVAHQFVRRGQSWAAWWVKMCTCLPGEHIFFFVHNPIVLSMTMYATKQVKFGHHPKRHLWFLGLVSCCFNHLPVALKTRIEVIINVLLERQNPLNFTYRKVSM